MRHKKKLAFAAIVFAAVPCFWPRGNIPARETLNVLPSLIDVPTDQGEVSTPTAPADDECPTQLDFAVGCLCVTDATAGFLAESRGSREMIWGTTRSSEAVLEQLRRLDEFALFNRAHRQASVEFQRKNQANLCLVFAQGSFGSSGTSSADFTQATFQVAAELNKPRLRIQVRFPREATDHFLLEIQGSSFGCVKASENLGRGMTTTSTRTMRVSLRPGESLVCGGLTQRGVCKTDYNLPFLSGLPWVGSWFRVNYEREVEEELIVVVTPRRMGERAPN